MEETNRRKAFVKVLCSTKWCSEAAANADKLDDDAGNSADVTPFHTAYRPVLLRYNAPLVGFAVAHIITGSLWDLYVFRILLPQLEDKAC